MGDIATVVGGSTPKSKEAAYWGGDIPWLAVSDLTGYPGIYIDGGARSITQAGFDSCAARMLPEGSVVFSSRAPIGYVAIASRSLCTSQGFKSFVLNDGICPRYVYWYLRSATSVAENLASGTTFKELSGRRAAAIPIPVAPPAEQHAIVKRIEALMSSVDAGEAHIEITRHKAGILLQSAIDHVLTNQRFSVARSDIVERLRGERVAAAQASGRRVKEATAPRDNLAHPRGWDLLSIEEVCEFVTDGDHNPPKRQGSGVPHLTAKHVRDLGIHPDGCTFISRDDYERIRKRYEPKAGDVILTCVGTIGRAAVVPVDTQFSPDRNLAGLRPLPSIRPRFLMFSLTGNTLQKRMATASGSTAQPHLYLGDLRALPIAVPPPAIQDRVIAVLERWRSLMIEAEPLLRAGRQRADALRRSVLNAAFRGELSCFSHAAGAHGNGGAP